MTTQETVMNAQPRRLLRSAVAVFSGFFAVAALSLGTDQILHVLKVYPPWGQPMNAPSLNLLALAYRTVYGVAGSYIAAKLAPRSPMAHALALGFAGLVLSTAGAITAITMSDLGPNWYPISLALTALPCAWLGGILHRAGRAERRDKVEQSRNTLGEEDSSDNPARRVLP